MIKKLKKNEQEQVDAVYHMSEMARLVQKYYDTTYPTGTRIGCDRIRAMLLFFLDTILYAVQNGEKVNLYGFGSFNRSLVSEAYYPNTLHNKACYRAAFHRVSFKPAKRVSDIVNNRLENPFKDSQTILDDLHDFSNPPPEQQTELEKFQKKLLERIQKDAADKEKAKED